MNFTETPEDNEQSMVSNRYKDADVVNFEILKVHPPSQQMQTLFLVFLFVVSVVNWNVFAFVFIVQ